MMIRVSIAHYICILIVFCKKIYIPTMNINFILRQWRMTLIHRIGAGECCQLLPLPLQRDSKRWIHDPKFYRKELLKLWSKQKLANRAFVERTEVTAMARITWDFLEHVIGDGPNYLNPKEIHARSKMESCRWNFGASGCLEDMQSSATIWLF